MSRGTGRSVQRESLWRTHLKKQRESGELIRGYCQRCGLSEPAFHFWRREIVRRDQESAVSFRYACKTVFPDGILQVVAA